MAVDLSDLADVLRREVTSPGVDQVTMTDSQATGYLSDSFWECVLQGLITGYTESDGIVTPSSGSTDLGRDYQQLIVFFAGYRIVRNQLRDIKTLFRAKSGPNEYETQQAAIVLQSLLKNLEGRLNQILAVIGQYANVPTYVIDGIAARDDSYTQGYTYWVR